MARYSIYITGGNSEIFYILNVIKFTKSVCNFIFCVIELKAIVTNNRRVTIYDINNLI